MFRKLISVAFAGLMSAGCAVFGTVEPTIKYHADVNFSEPERMCLKGAADQWRTQTQGLADMEYVYDYDSKSTRSVVEHQLHHRLGRWTSDMTLVKEIEAYDEKEANLPPDSIHLLGIMRTKDGIHNDFGKPVEVDLVADLLTDPRRCQQVAMHEFGHAFGMFHDTSWPPPVMYPHSIQGMSACLKKADLVQFCALNNCGSVEMKPCPDDPFGPEEG